MNKGRKQSQVHNVITLHMCQVKVIQNYRLTLNLVKEGIIKNWKAHCLNYKVKQFIMTNFFFQEKSTYSRRHYK